MQATSSFSTNLDPYRAGAEIGDALAEIDPEVIFLFTSIHFDGSRELVEAIYDALGSDDATLIGCTGDGFYEKDAVADVGVSALGINSGGTVRWRVAHESGVADAPGAAAERCVKTLNAACTGTPAFYFLTTDFRTDTREIISALQRSATAPVVGGSAGDDSAFARCYVYVGREVLTDADGPIQHQLFVAQTLQPMGRRARITDVDGTTVRTIDGVPAMDFIERELGKPLDVVDEGIITLTLTDDAHGGGRRIRSLLLPSDRTDRTGVKLFGSVGLNDWAQVCLAPSSRMLEDVRRIGSATRQVPFQPLAGLVVSCAGRKRVLGALMKISSEVDRGSMFTVLFPANTEAIAARAARAPTTEMPTGQEDRGTILVADDEDFVREVCEQMLERLGFTVLAARDGLEAIELYRAHADVIVCVLLDLTMPGMNGDESLRQMQRIDPLVRGILCSGYSEQEVGRRFGEPVTFLQKPFGIRSLERAVKTVLSDVAEV